MKLTTSPVLVPSAIQMNPHIFSSQDECNTTLAQLRAGKLAGTTRLDLCLGELTEFPREIFELADSLEILNLNGNKLRTLPNDLCRLSRLKILFCSNNEFTHLPEALGECSQLSMVGFKANKIVEIYPKSLPSSLRWLILTDNCIGELPHTIGQCKHLQKLMLSGNRLERFPEEMKNCTALELIRLAANRFEDLPSWLLSLPKLAWLAFAGNPCSTNSQPSIPKLLEVSWQHLCVKNKLGEGASGKIYDGVWCKDEGYQDVAIKLFKNAMTSDGLPTCEMQACLAAGLHKHLIPVFGQINDHPECMEGLVMALIDHSYQTLAGPPSFETCTRDVYEPTFQLTPTNILFLLKGVASAAAHLHERGILHGDLYAHNILWREDGSCYLGDFGAATFYHTEHKLAAALQGIEIRAFGCLIEELLEQCHWCVKTQNLKKSLQLLQERCLQPIVESRPSFAMMINELSHLAE